MIALEIYTGGDFQVGAARLTRLFTSCNSEDPSNLPKEKPEVKMGHKGFNLSTYFEAGQE